MSPQIVLATAIVAVTTIAVLGALVVRSRRTAVASVSPPRWLMIALIAGCVLFTAALFTTIFALSLW